MGENVKPLAWIAFLFTAELLAQTIPIRFEDDIPRQDLYRYCLIVVRVLHAEAPRVSSSNHDGQCAK